VLDHLVIQSITGTVIANPRVDSKSIAAASDRKEWYRSAKSETVGPTGKLQHTSASRESGLLTESKWSRTLSVADCTATQAPANRQRLRAKGKPGKRLGPDLH
jgi:hypothetical protein